MSSKFGKSFRDASKGVYYANNLVDNVTQLTNDPSAIAGITEDVIRGAKNGGFDGVLGALKNNLFGGTSPEDEMSSGLGSRNGLATNNRWLLEFTLPSNSVMSNYQKDSRDAALFCQSVSLPGKQLLTAEADDFKRAVKMPYQYAVDDVDFSFLCTNDMIFKKIFDDWMNIPINPETNRANYPEEYRSDIGIIMQDKQDGEIYKQILLDAYPIAMTSVPLTQGQNEIVSLNVTVTYHSLKYVSSASSDFSVFGIGGNNPINVAAGISSKLPVQFF
jgi:hypothetical protein